MFRKVCAAWIEFLVPVLLAASYCNPALADAGTRKWTGLYGGLNFGAAIDNSHYALSPSGCFLVGCAPPANNPLRTDTEKFDGIALIGGAQLGYNAQFKGIVVGLETDFNYSGLRDDDPVNRALAAPLVGNFVHNVSTSLRYVGTLRGQVGITPIPELLLYATGGLAYGQVKSRTNAEFTEPPPPDNDAYAGANSTWHLGWAIGGGGELKLTSHWSAKFEYLRIDLGKLGYSNPCITPIACAGIFPAPSFQTDLQLREDIVRVGLNYHFGGR